MDEEVVYNVKYIDKIKAYRVTSPNVKGLCVIEPTADIARAKARSLAKVILAYRKKINDSEPIRIGI